MKAKQLLVLIILSTFILETKAQLKVGQYGGVGLGIEPRADYKLIIKGNLLLTTYPEIPPPLSRYTEFRIKVGNGWPGCEFGTPTRGIAVWSSEVGYNDLYARHIYRSSDTTLKTEITPLLNALEKVIQIQSYSYKMKYDSIVDNRLSFGFLAQEINEILPDIVDSAKGTLLIDYDQIMPFIVGAIQEQQKTIDSLRNVGQEEQRSANSANDQLSTLDSLKSLISQMQSDIANCCKIIQTIPDKSDFQNGSRLFQNRPNPFSESTKIEFDIQQSFNCATILVFDMSGTLKKSMPISQKGKGQIIIDGFNLTAGMYLYSLIVDEVEIDTKRMILVN